LKINDAIWGAVLFLLAAVILVHVQTFPKIPGQQVGPALFPGLIAAGLGVCALLLVAKGLAARTAGGGHQRWVTPEDWVASPRHLLAFALVIGVNVFYILVVDRIGFIPTGVIYLSVLFLVFQVRRRWIIPLAIIITLGIHYAFYKLLKVPLAWGWLQGIAW